LDLDRNSTTFLLATNYADTGWGVTPQSSLLRRSCLSTTLAAGLQGSLRLGLRLFRFALLELISQERHRRRQHLAMLPSPMSSYPETEGVDVDIAHEAKWDPVGAVR